MRISRLKPHLSLLIVLSLLITPFTVFAEEKKKKGPPKRLTPVLTSVVEERVLAPTIKVPGTIVSRQQAELPAEVDGKLMWVADVGSKVKKGQALAKLDDTLYRLKASENKASLVQTTTRLKFLEKELLRLKELEKSDFSSKTELDKTELDRDLARSEKVVAEAKVALDNETLARYQVKAPYSGIVIERTKREGEWINGGDTVIVFSNPKALEIEARVTEKSIRHLKPGDKLKIHHENNVSTGILRTIVDVGDKQSHLYDIRVDVNNSWLAGQVVKVEVPTGQAKEVLAVPRDALVLRRSGISIFKLNEENAAQKITVKTGIASSDLIEVIGDVSPGDTIVVRGSERLRPGQQVKVIQSK